MKRCGYSLAGLIGLLLFLPNAGKTEPAAVRISVPFSLSSIPVMELNGRELAGRRIQVTFFQDHTLALAEFIRGDSDVLMTGFTQGLAAFAADRTVRHLATPVWGVSSIVVRDPSLRNLEDLVGKTILMPFAKSPLDLQTRALLKAKGLLERVTVEYAPPQQAAALLLAGQADAIAVPEPLPAQLIAGGKARRLKTYQDLWAELTGGEARSPQVSVFIRAQFAAAHPKLPALLVTEAAASVRALAGRADALAARHAGAFKLDKAVLREGLAHTLFGIPGRAETVSLCDDYAKRIGLSPIDRAFFYE